jgi:hypothetical protein
MNQIEKVGLRDWTAVFIIANSWPDALINPGEYESTTTFAPRTINHETPKVCLSFFH